MLSQSILKRSKVLCHLLIASLFLLVSASQVWACIGIGISHHPDPNGPDQLGIFYSATTTYDGEGANRWNSQVFTLRWPAALGAGVVTGVVNQAGFVFTPIGLAASGGDGFFYRKFVSSTPNVLQNLANGQVLEVLRLNTNLSTINLNDFELVTAPNSWVVANFGTAHIENAVLGEQFGLFVPMPPVVVQATCAAPNPSISVSTTGNGIVEYSINNGASFQTSGNFTNLAAGNYHIYVRLQGNPACSIAYNGNPLTINAVPSPPVVNVPGLTQPTCSVPTGTIMVNATGSGALEYSINNGSTWQSSPAFINLVLGNYHLAARLQSDNTCSTFYVNNPVLLNEPTGCCPGTLAVDLTPIPNGVYEAAEVITSTGTVPASGNVIFSAGASVELQAGFEVGLGGVFEVLMVGCVQ